MGQIEKTVFISYRRTDMPWALAVYQHLTMHDYDVFFDYESINSGDFEQIIIGNIKARAHFIVILTPSALDRCMEPNDWLRREIEIAMDYKRNIIPLIMEGFDFGNPSVTKNLTGKLATLKKYNGLSVPPGYFNDAMRNLRLKFLNISLNAVLRPVSNTVQKAVKRQQDAANKISPISQQDLMQNQLHEFEFVALGPNLSYVFIFDSYGYLFNGIPESLGATINELNRQAIKIKSIALGPNSSYVVLYGRNGYEWQGIPAELANKLEEQNKRGVEFISIALGEDSSFVFLFNVNGYFFKGIPKGLADKIREQNKLGVEFISVALGPNSSYVFLFNFNGYWYQGIPQNLVKIMNEKYEQGFKYKSVALGPNSSYVFLYGSNGYWLNGTPDALVTRMRELHG
jgi:hypothetical protein